MFTRYNHQQEVGSTSIHNSNNDIPHNIKTKTKLQKQKEKIQERNEKKTSIFNVYREGKQKIMISFYNLYRNYPSEPCTFSKNPIWLMGKCYSNSLQCSYNSSQLQQPQQQYQQQIPIQQLQQYQQPQYQQPQQLQQQQPKKSNLFQTLFSSNKEQQMQQQMQQQQQQYQQQLYQQQLYQQQLYQQQQQYQYYQIQQQQQLQQQQQQQPQLNLNNRQSFINNVNSFHEMFLKDFKSLIWFSYRKDFPPIQKTNITTDIGWGCMVRTGQMILSRGFVRHFYQNEDVYKFEQERGDQKYRMILSWFNDIPSQDHSYSIHEIVYSNKLIERKNSKAFIDTLDNVEEWFAPTKICNVLRYLVKSQNFDDLEIYVPLDGVIYKDYIKNLCEINNNNSNVNNVQKEEQKEQEQQDQQQDKPLLNRQHDNLCSSSNPSLVPVEVEHEHVNQIPCSPMDPSPLNYHDDSNNNNNNNNNEELSSPAPESSSSTPIVNQWKSLIILIPVRLGVDKINPVYIEKLKQMLKLQQSIGMIGGKPKQSFYFVGFQDNQIIYLDPHFVNETVDPNSLQFPETYQGCIPQKMPFSELDPSLAIGFYCRDQLEFNDLCFKLLEIESEGFPILSIGDQCPEYQVENDDPFKLSHSMDSDLFPPPEDQTLDEPNSNNSNDDQQVVRNIDYYQHQQQHNDEFNDDNDNNIDDDDVDEDGYDHIDLEDNKHATSLAVLSSNNHKVSLQSSYRQEQPIDTPDYSSDSDLDDFTMVG